MKSLQPPDSYYLRAAIGWLELGNHLEANEELEKIALRYVPTRTFWKFDLRFIRKPRNGTWRLKPACALFPLVLRHPGFDISERRQN